MARNERQEDDGRGGVSTITRPGVRPRPAPASRPTAVPRPGVRQRPGAKPVPNAGGVPTARGVPMAGGVPNARTAPSPSTARARAAAVAFPAGTHRLPFVLLLCGLLGGALVCALVISTTLAAGAFEITNLQNSTSAQAKQLQSLEEEVAQAQSPQQIASRAAELGMVGPGVLRFIDLKTGKTATDADPNWVGKIPGYYP